MTQTIEIKAIKEIQRGKETEFVEDGNRDLIIKPMTTVQFLQATRILKETIDSLTADENISGALAGLFDNVDEEDSAMDAISKAGSQFLKDAAGSVGLLIEVAPESANQLIATMAGMHPAELGAQPVLKFFDIFDAVIEENDIQAVVDRVKSSYKKLGQAMGWLKVIQEAAAPRVIK